MGSRGGEEVVRMVKSSKSSNRSSRKPKGRAKAAAHKPAGPRSRSSAKPKTRARVKAARSSKLAGARTRVVAESKKADTINKHAEAPRLLRENKTTNAALVLLEKGIKLIYQKEFRKARIELKSLLDSYPGESEILARVRTYLQICEREGQSHKKPTIGSDQLYTVGVMEHNRADYEKAISYFRQSLDENPSADHIYYSLAASFAMKGETAESLNNLQKAIGLNEENRVYAKNDSDFTSLHSQKEFNELVGWNQTGSSGQP
jgi:tetratricopeptide (TPR) repeat protein